MDVRARAVGACAESEVTTPWCLVRSRRNHHLELLWFASIDEAMAAARVARGEGLKAEIHWRPKGPEGVR